MAKNPFDNLNKIVQSLTPHLRQATNMHLTVGPNPIRDAINTGRGLKMTEAPDTKPFKPSVPPQLK